MLVPRGVLLDALAERLNVEDSLLEATLSNFTQH